MSNNTNEGILNPGEVLNNTYVIAEMVASGGTGEVYRATNRVSGREIAIKILKREFAQNEQFANLMKREAAVLHELVTESVVRYYDLLESTLHGGFLFIVMEFIHGDSLNVNMKKGIPMPAEVVIRVAHRVLLGLHAAHSQKLFHRDLSPDNIILKDGEARKATLIDFGIAKDVNEGAKTIVGGGFAGKYQYAAPEQIEGFTDARSDIYSLGMTLLSAFRGASPGKGATLVEILDSKNKKSDISGVPEPLLGLISKMVEPDPVDRFQSAEEALVYLESSGAILTTAVPFTTSPPRGVPTGTVVVPPPASVETVVEPDRPAAPAPDPKPAPVSALESAPEPARKRRGGMLVVVILLLVAGGVGGAWYAGLLAPEPGTTPTAPVAATTVKPTEPAVVKEAVLPVASPYFLTVTRTGKSGPITLRGNLSSAKSIAQITALLEKGLNTRSVVTEIIPARGQPYEGWDRRIIDVALEFKDLDTWSISASDKTLSVSGATQNAAEKSALLGAVRRVMNGLDVAIIDQLSVIIPPVPLRDINNALAFFRTCGALSATGGTNGMLAPGDTIKITGLVARSSDITKIKKVLNEAAPGRRLNLPLKVVNKGVCSVVQVLPNVKSELIDIEYSYGSSDREVSGDTYKLGENPVIDIELDARIKGYLNVIFVDFGDQVFHLMPHRARTENKLQHIGKVKDGKRTIRAAFPISQASVKQLGFKVVEPVGANMIVAIVTPEPLFTKLRPRAEANSAFVKAAKKKLRKLDGITGFATFRPLVTKP